MPDIRCPKCDGITEVNKFVKLGKLEVIITCSRCLKHGKRYFGELEEEEKLTNLAIDNWKKS